MHPDHQLTLANAALAEERVGKASLIGGEPRLEMIIQHRDAVGAQHVQKVLHLVLLVTVRHPVGE